MFEKRSPQNCVHAFFHCNQNMKLDAALDSLVPQTGNQLRRGPIQKEILSSSLLFHSPFSFLRVPLPFFFFSPIFRRSAFRSPFFRARIFPSEFLSPVRFSDSFGIRFICMIRRQKCILSPRVVLLDVEMEK